MTLKIKRTILLLAVSVLPIIGKAQVFPVQVTPQLIPPYSLRLSEYNTSGKEHLTLSILLTDITDFNRAVKLKLYITNNAGIAIKTTDFAIDLPTHTIDGGIPLRLSNIDLQTYFSPENITGITPQQYSQPLPDGLYDFCFEVYDAQSGHILSRKSCATAYLILNDPPFLNSPAKDCTLIEKNPQNIVFQWTPRHLNATNVVYTFTLVEIWDNLRDPQSAFLSGRPLYETTTNNTSLLYGPSETTLLPDKTYAWRIKAFINDGLSENGVFKNDGYSEIYHFMYATACEPPHFIVAESKDYQSETILWQGKSHLQYTIQYRKKKSDNTTWFEVNSFNEKGIIYNLEANTVYEYRVGGQCAPDDVFSYSGINEFTTTTKNKKGTYNCGIPPQNNIINQKPLETLVVNEVFTAGDFPVTVKLIQGNKGTFTGWGYIRVPYLDDTRIKVHFKDVKINTDYQLTSGIINTDFDATGSNINDIKDEIEAVQQIYASALQQLETAINKIREGALTGKDLEGLINELKNDLPLNDIKKLESIQQEITAAETALEKATTPEEKEKIKNEIKALNEQFADVAENIKDKVSGLIVKAIENYYIQNKSQEQKLIADFKNIIPEQKAYTTTNAEDVDFQFEFEGESENINLSANLNNTFETQEKYHLYFASKAIAENKSDNATIQLFINKALENEIDLLKIMKESQDKGDAEKNTLQLLAESIEKALKGLINKYKYTYLK